MADPVQPSGIEFVVYMIFDTVFVNCFKRRNVLITVQFLNVPCNKKLCLDKWHEILIGTIRKFRNAKKFEIPTTEI